MLKTEITYLPCVKVLNSPIPIHHSPDLDKGLLHNQIEDAEKINHGEDGEQEEEGRGLNITPSEDDKDQYVAKDAKCANARKEDPIQDSLQNPGVNTVARRVVCVDRHIFWTHVNEWFLTKTYSCTYTWAGGKETEMWAGELFTFVLHRIFIKSTINLYGEEGIHSYHSVLPKMPVCCLSPGVKVICVMESFAKM